MQQNKDGEPKSFKPLGHFSLLVASFLLTLPLLGAGNFEDFKRFQAQSFSKYKDERDNAFNKHLKSQWEAYNAYKGTPLYEKPKSKVLPDAQLVKPKSVGPKVSIEIKSPKDLTTYKKDEKKEKKPQIVAKETVKKDINFEFFGTAVSFDIAKGMKSARFYPQNKDGILSFFNSCASSDYDTLIREIKRESSVMNLNDWGLYLLVLEISKQVHQNQDDANMLSWFLFNKLGYAVKVGLANNHVVLMHYSEKIIYDTPNYIFDNKKYYVISNYAKGSAGRLYSYKQDYPEATKPLDLALKSLPKFDELLKSKTLHFENYSREYTLFYEYNQNLLDFMATYPQADYETFFNAPMDERTYSSIAKDMKKYVDGMSASDAINFVLHFVQKSFIYETDQEQFAREKVMFATETLYYDKSDCEDRATLFSYLIKELFGISVLGVKYKDHMATALYVPMSGDSIEVNKKKFIVADPTYINSNIGQSMPKYKSINPESFVVVKRD
ncbi:hypothetical protein M947_02270 [Sulfurimonas hongkongensis]|uniref:Transglutaminase-like domain-containing protein n=1 Tax=Sulfurimonas hongkongensis TaxID=1172190 RepID=T0JHW2_9BACT|nr:hypothetical protein [Sulfurimonas hongkongensis]EQB40655.1 hypothetical protein M947_02270 [Sulfurimonas hongkongensis]